jgi:hypothetical protein
MNETDQKEGSNLLMAMGLMDEEPTPLGPEEDKMELPAGCVAQIESARTLAPVMTGCDNKRGPKEAGWGAHSS